MSDSNYIFNNLLDDLKSTREKDKELFDSISTKSKKNFYDTYIINDQLNNAGLRLADQLESSINTWLNNKYRTFSFTSNNQQNILDDIIDILNQDNNFLKTYIHEYEFDRYFNDDFKIFIKLVCKYLYNTI